MILINEMTRNKAINFNVLYLLSVCGVGVMARIFLTVGYWSWGLLAGGVFPRSQWPGVIGREEGLLP